MLAPGDGHGIDVACTSCGRPFQVARSLKGGLTNCPGCGALVELRGGVDLDFAALVALGVVLVLGVTAVAWAAGGMIAAVVAFLVAAAILAAVILAS